MKIFIRKYPTTLLITLFMSFGPFFAYGQSAREVVEKMDMKMRGEYSTQEMTMTIVRP